MLNLADGCLTVLVLGAKLDEIDVVVFIGSWILFYSFLLEYQFGGLHAVKLKCHNSYFSSEALQTSNQNNL